MTNIIVEMVSKLSFRELSRIDGLELAVDTNI